MTQSFDTPEFLNYLQKRLNFEPFVLRDLVKDHSIFETAEILVKNYNVDKDKLGQIFAGYLGFAYVDINNVIMIRIKVGKDVAKSIVFVNIDFAILARLLP